MISERKQVPKPAAATDRATDAAISQSAGAADRGMDRDSADDVEEDGFELLKKQHRELKALVRESENITSTEQAENLQKNLLECWRKHEVLHQVLYEEACHMGLRTYEPLADAEVVADLVSFLLNTRVPYEKYVDIARLRVAGKIIHNFIEDEERSEKGLIDKMKAAGVSARIVGEFYLDHKDLLVDEPGRTKLKLRHLSTGKTPKHAGTTPLPRPLPLRDHDPGQAPDPRADDVSVDDGTVKGPCSAGQKRQGDAGQSKHDDQDDEAAKHVQHCIGRGGWWDG
ncbi:hypothetical protein Q0601_07290 [Paracoccus onubensis]|uniref:hypothetical protein n=1 Tax=Paracoccus onubensis TaxID=1675788 RepID=UPI002731D235|nr:hypothetical protein [Paracoccus onubensis]MDP0926969.1 hypothetical protein [Paracoccus onubensis]